MSSKLAPNNNLLLTGSSGVGKSTLLKSVGQQLKGYKVKGFFGDMNWEDNERKGWRLDTFDGDGGVLAHLDMNSEYRMGKYGVNMALFEHLVDSQLKLSGEANIYLVDEIGIIALWSPEFVTSMSELLDSSKRVVAIVRQRGDGFVQDVKDRSDVEIWEVTRENREEVRMRTLSWITSN